MAGFSENAKTVWKRTVSKDCSSKDCKDNNKRNSKDGNSNDLVLDCVHEQYTAMRKPSL